MTPIEQQIFEALKTAARSGSQSPPRNLSTTEQIVELRERLARYMRDDQTPVPGDIVQEKAGLGFRRSEVRRRDALIFVRSLDPSSAMDLALIHDWRTKFSIAVTVDCVVWSLPEVEEPTVVSMLFDSHDLEVLLSAEQPLSAYRRPC